MIRRIGRLASLALIVVTGADGAQGAAARPVRHPPAPYRHARGFDAFGYYFPSEREQVGRGRLDDIAIGQLRDFSAWERGRRSRAHSPVMAEFSDVSSPTHRNELGQEVHRITVRVLADSYRVAPGDFSFTGHDPRLGRVTVSGRIDAAALARAREGGRRDPVIFAGVAFAGEHDRNVSFTWFGGD